MPPAGYVCFLRDVSYGNCYQIRVVGAPAELSRHLAQAFEVEVALVFQADDAERFGRELLEFAGGASAGEWFDLADDQLQHLRELGLDGQRGQHQRRRTQTFSSLLEESGPRSSRPRSTSHRHVNRAAAIPSQRQERPARQRSTAHRTTNRATTPPPPETSARAAQPRRRNRNSRLFFIIVFLIIFGGLYGAITERDPVADLLHLAGTARAFTVNTQATETATAIPTKPPPTATFTATAPPPTATERQPLAVRLARASYDAVRFEWTRASGALSYQYRYSVNGGALSRWRGTTLLGKTVAGLSPGDSVIFQLRARYGDSYTPIAQASASALSGPTATSTPTNPPPTATFTATAPPPTATLTATAPPPTATFTATAPPPTATLTATYTSTATSSPEPSATSTWTPVPSATSSLRMVVETRNGLGANVRACPWTSCEIIDTLRPGHEIFGLGRVEGEEVYGSTVWVQFEIDGVAAYIHSELIEAKR